MRLVVILAFFLGLASAPTALAATHASSGYLYLTPTKIQNNVESYGFHLYGRRYNVDTAKCLGLRRYGVRASNTFHGFKCNATTADTSTWTLWLLTDATRYYVDSFTINYVANPRVANCLNYGGTPKQCLKASG